MGVGWLLWLAFMVVFLVSPIGYGWSYRGWGPPYPRFVQRRRGLRARRVAATEVFDHHAWGVGGDFVWMTAMVAAIWVVVALWSR